MLFEFHLLLNARKSLQVICKYVRREIRSLSTSDRDRYFAALEIVHRMSLDEGIALYGDKFKNYEYFTAKHLNAQSMNDCTWLSFAESPFSHHCMSDPPRL